MKRKLILSLVIAIFLFSIVAVQPVVADPHQHFEFNVGAFGYQTYYGAIVEGHGGYGSFTVHYDDITFFICDQENFDKYKNGESYSAYCFLEDVVSGNYKFRYTHADTWYFVFCNKDSIYAKDITFDVYRDTTPPDTILNLDTGATYSGVKEIRVTATDVTFDVYRIRLYINGILKRTVYGSDSLIYNWITTDYVNGQYTVKVVAEDTVNNQGEVERVVTVYNAPPPPEIVSTPSDKSIDVGEKATLTWGFKYTGQCTWKIRIGNSEVKSGSGTGSSSTQYASYAFTSTQSGQFTAKFSLYYEGKVLEDVVFITVIQAVIPTTTTTTGETSQPTTTTGETTKPITTGRTTDSIPLDDPMVLLGIFVLLFVLGAGIVYVVMKKKKGGTAEIVEQTISGDDGDKPKIPILEKTILKEVVGEEVIEKDFIPAEKTEITREIITERVFVICPYCGAKTEQGIMKCQNCGADL
jgi:hypothetical protein